MISLLLDLAFLNFRIDKTLPKGTILLECGKMFQDAGYEIKVLNTINFKKSMHYNPFAYIKDEKDILKLVNTLIVNTKGEGQQATEDFGLRRRNCFIRLTSDTYITNVSRRSRISLRL